MSEVTCYVALPFVPSDHGIALGEAIECANPNSAVMRPKPCRANPAIGAVASSRAAGSRNRHFSDAS
jgi:hypothetical protein